jgi:DNA excision repair protein ERCC-2
MVFADRRYNRMDKRSKLPIWVAEELTEQRLNLSTDMAVSAVREFLKVQAQPQPKDALVGKALWSFQQLQQYQSKKG